MVPNFYKGWNVIVEEKQLGTETKLYVSLNKLLAWLQEYMSVDTVTLLLPSDQQNLGVYATIGLEEEIEQKIRIPIGKGFAGQIAASVKPIIVNNLSEIEVVSPILREKGLRSLVGIPVPIQQNVVGVLHVGTLSSNNFTKRNVEQLQRVSHVIEGIIAEEVGFQFELGYQNRESCWEVLGLRIPVSHVNTLQQFILNRFILGSSEAPLVYCH